MARATFAKTHSTARVMVPHWRKPESRRYQTHRLAERKDLPAKDREALIPEGAVSEHFETLDDFETYIQTGSWPGLEGYLRSHEGS